MNFRSILILAAALMAGEAHAQALLWSEEFDGGPTLDPAVWGFDLGDGCAAGICGWGNGEFQHYTDDPANVRVEGGQLIITALRPDIDTFTSARVNTLDKLSLRYGTIEARIKLPDLGDGLWPAFWTMGANIDSVGWPACGEIDIFEMGNATGISNGTVNRRVSSAAHWDVNGDYAGYGGSYTSATDLNGEFHIYRMEWTPFAVSTYIDGIWIWTISIQNPQNFSGEEFHAPHFMLLNMAVGGNYTGITENAADITATFPAEYRVDWIRIYDNGFAELLRPGVPIQLAADVSGPNIELSFDTQANLDYEVLYKTDLSDPTWILLQDVNGTGGAVSVLDSIASPAAYYLIEAR